MAHSLGEPIAEPFKIFWITGRDLSVTIPKGMELIGMINLGEVSTIPNGTGGQSPEIDRTLHSMLVKLRESTPERLAVGSVGYIRSGHGELYMVSYTEAQAAEYCYTVLGLRIIEDYVYGRPRAARKEGRTHHGNYWPALLTYQTQVKRGKA